MLDRLLEVVRAGESRALVVRGEPGVGKTALLEYIAGRARGCRVVRSAGVQAEMELSFAGLHQLCGPMLDRLGRLPGPQREALSTAFGLRTGNPPDRFLVGLAVLGLLAEAAEERPLICLVDDTQWLDRASVQVLTLVARRLYAESVALVFATRESVEAEELTGLAELMVSGLPDGEARALLGSALSGPLDERVLDQIVAETGGNPLALLELPRGLTAAELAGGFGLPGARALSRRIEESFQRQLAPLTAQSRELLLVAAADPLGDPVLLWRAADRLGIGIDAAASELVEFGVRVRFRHPLVRSAIYRAAPLEQRQRAHHALAQATDAEADPDRRAWHRAQAAPGPDEDVAAELERSAGRAQERGGLPAAAAFLQRAVELTREPERRTRRALAAARAALGAGAPDAALGLLSIAYACPLDAFQHASVDLLRAQIAFAMSPGSEAPQLLLKAAQQLQLHDVRLARETYLEALSAAMFAGRLASGGGVIEVAEAVRAAPPPSQPVRPTDLLLDGLAARNTGEYVAGTQLLKRALSAFRDQDMPREEGLRWLWLAASTTDLWDAETWEVLATRHVRLAREAGALTTLPLALNSRVAVHILHGELAAAASLVDEVKTAVEAIGIDLAPYAALLLASWQGREDQTRDLVKITRNEVTIRGEGIGLTVCDYATALLCNSLGRYEEAVAATQPVSEEHPTRGAGLWALAERVEAAARSGMPEHAADAFQQLSKTTSASGTEWALGIEARSRALLIDGETAENAYREAIDRLARTRVRGELARAHLVYGEWLRRENRRLDAREQLRAAHEMFSGMGMAAFADRAARELRAAGETARKRTAEPSTELTAQETQIARLVRDGLSNPEIGARLFISPRTVEWHLSKVFGKLGISSRRQLRSSAQLP
jgi:DNA-binding CsgD family transcriptional regulator/tetratricopeptide (TPR) repeat protein